MSQTFPQSVRANSSLPGVADSRHLAPWLRLDKTDEKARLFRRLEIRRGLQVHRRLAKGLTLVGLALALIYLLNAWSIRTAPNLNEFEHRSLGRTSKSFLNKVTPSHPDIAVRREESVTRYRYRGSNVDAVLQDPIRMGNGFGLPGLAGSVVAPWYSANSGIFRNALVLLLSFIFLGGAIAIVAHRADPRIYISSEVEQLLGFPPMAQLPDFSEVASAITDDHLLRLASAIDLGFRERDFSRCVFCGTGPEVGVTTIATRLKPLLETMGRATVVEDVAAGSNETEEIRGKIILIDASPLADSIETERLVQSAHCTIVVIESGVTTRAQLRTAANILQRIQAPAVGFVLNRVRLATADPEFRRSIREMGKRQRKQDHATNSQMLQTLEQAIEQGRASLDLDVATSLNRPVENPPENVAANVPQFDESFRTGNPLVASPAPHASIRGLQLVSRSQTEPTNQAREEIPLPPAEIASQFDQLPPEPKAERTGAPFAVPSGPNSTTHDPAKPAWEKTARASLPRLSELRGMRFSQALRELDHARRPASTSSGIETLMSAIAPFESMFTRSEPASVEHDDSPQGPPSEFDLPASLRAFVPISESRVSSGADSGISAELNGAEGNHSNSAPPQPGPNEKNVGHSQEETEGPAPEQNRTRKRMVGPFEHVQILPSRRGQYKRKS